MCLLADVYTSTGRIGYNGIGSKQLHANSKSQQNIAHQELIQERNITRCYYYYYKREERRDSLVSHELREVNALYAIKICCLIWETQQNHSVKNK
jgi:hypothetical protein